MVLLSFAGALQLDGFVASDMWVQRWKRRLGISTLRSTSISQKVPGDFRDLLFNYRRAVLMLRRQHDYPLNCVMNIDQTMLRFDMLPQRTNDKKGCRQVRTKTTRAEKRGFTVTLFVAADGTKFPAMIVFKERNGQIPPRVYQQLQVPDNNRVHATRNGWMTREALMVWIRRILGRADGCRLLVLDSYPAHRTQEVREALLERNVDVVYIPGGCTPLAQPVDVSITKPFKDAVRDTWVTWMREDRPLTAAAISDNPPDRMSSAGWVEPGTASDLTSSSLPSRGAQSPTSWMGQKMTKLWGGFQRTLWFTFLLPTMPLVTRRRKRRKKRKGMQTEKKKEKKEKTSLGLTSDNSC